MVCLPDQLPLLKLCNQEAVSYEEGWLDSEISRAAERAGKEDWFLAKDVTRAVTKYLRHRYPRNTITIDELRQRVERALEFLGCDDVARTLEIGRPPVTIPLAEVIHDAGQLGERTFYALLSERLATAEATGTREIVCEGIRSACKRLCRVNRWTPECEVVAGEVVEFITAEVLEYRPGGSIDVIVR